MSKTPYKMDQDLRKGKICIIVKFRITDLVIWSHCREGKTPSYSQINAIVQSKLVKLPKKKGG